MEGETLTSFRESVEIAAAPDVVWALVEDIPRHAEFAGPKSITKVIDFDGEPAVGRRWIAHEKFLVQKFDAPSEITAVEGHRLAQGAVQDLRAAGQAGRGRTHDVGCHQEGR